jgi:hypothetical protein
MSDKAKEPPMETIAPSVGPNTTGLTDQARASQWRKEDAGDEPAPDPAAPATRRSRKRTRKPGGE